MTERISRFRSPYYVLAGAYGYERREPAALFLANGFTDDVFPADEVLRYANLHRKLYPRAPLTVLFFDGGHQRANNKRIDHELVQMPRRMKAFLDHHVKGVGKRPASDVTAFTQSCPATEPPRGPFTGRTWADLHPGEVRYGSRTSQTVLSLGGDLRLGLAFDPIAGGPACRTTDAADQGAGVASYRLPAATGEGYTLLGSPTVIADFQVTGVHAYLAARLLDVDPSTGRQTLIARGTYRFDPAAANGRQVFQLHANGWHFAPGHVPKLELLGQDATYTRPANGVFSVLVSDLQLRLPVHETPGAKGTPAEVRRPLRPEPYDPDVPVPGDRSCDQRRTVTVRVPGARRAKIRRVTVMVGGKRIKARRLKDNRVRLTLRDRPRGRTTVRVTLRTKTGRTLRATRVYRMCA